MLLRSCVYPLGGLIRVPCRSACAWARSRQRPHTLLSPCRPDKEVHAHYMYEVADLMSARCTLALSTGPSQRELANAPLGYWSGVEKGTPAQRHPTWALSVHGRPAFTDTSATPVATQPPQPHQPHQPHQAHQRHQAPQAPQAPQAHQVHQPPQ